MIHQFFGFREQPFGVTPDPRYLYFGFGHREALASLFYGIEENRGFLSLIARPGMGKTTLLFHLLGKLRHSARTAFLFQTQCSSRELLRFLLAEFGIPNVEDDLFRMHELFNSYLLEQSTAGHRVIVVIDEAQNLDPSVMETVRLLSNFETPRGKLLQIILSGQPELATKLASHSLSQLQQRIASFNRLEPLSVQEVAEFIDHRLHVARYQGPAIFDNNAKVMIANLSEGIPRNINNLCFGALSLACALRKKHVDAEIVQDVFNDLDLQKLIPASMHGSAHQSKTLVLPSIKVSVARPQNISKVAASATSKPKPAETATSPIAPSTAEKPKVHDLVRDARMMPTDVEEFRPTMKGASRSKLWRLAALAVLVMVVGNGTTKVANSVIRIASPLRDGALENVPSIIIANVKDDERLPWREPFANRTTSLLEPVKGMAGAESAPSISTLNNQLRHSAGVNSTVTIGAKGFIPITKQLEKVTPPSEDPAELWQLVKGGSIKAEIKLATVYLDGSVVEQDCRQAHLLLMAASRKGSKEASGLLNNEYLERCHE